MLSRSKKSGPQEAAGAPFEGECMELSDGDLEAVVGGVGGVFGPPPLEPVVPSVKVCEHCGMAIVPDESGECPLCGWPM